MTVHLSGGQEVALISTEYTMNLNVYLEYLHSFIHYNSWQGHGCHRKVIHYYCFLEDESELAVDEDEEVESDDEEMSDEDEPKGFSKDESMEHWQRPKFRVLRSV